MSRFIKTIKALFVAPDATTQAQAELAVSARELLNAHTNLEACRVEMKACEAHIQVLQERTKRLESYLGLVTTRG